MLKILARFRYPLLLLVILLAAGYYRLILGWNWDEQQLLHPDERFLTMVTERISIPAKVGDYFNTYSSTLNPHNNDYGLFVYGTLPIFLTEYIGQLSGSNAYGEVHFVGRVLASVFDLLTIVLVFMFGGAIGAPMVGLLGAFFLAFSPQNIQLSHFYGVENFVAFFVALTLLILTGFFTNRPTSNIPKVLSAKYGWGIFTIVGVLSLVFSVYKGQPIYIWLLFFLLTSAVTYAMCMHARLTPYRRSLLVGIFLGAALASKISSIFLIPVICLTYFLRELHDELRSSTWSFSLGFFTLRFIIRGTSHLVVLSIAALFIFRIFQPYAFGASGLFDLSFVGRLFSTSWIADGKSCEILFAERFCANMREVAGLMQGGEFPPSIQWVNQPPIFFNLYNFFWWQMGPVWTVLAIAGVSIALIRGAFLLKLIYLPFVLWALFWFFYQSTQFVKAGRYFSTVYPFFALAAGITLIWSYHLIRDSLKIRGLKPSGHKILCSAIPSLLAILATIIWTDGISNIYRRPVTRLEASRWIYSNIPCGSLLAYEHWDDPLPMRVDGKAGFGNCYLGAEFGHYGHDDRAKLEKTLDVINRADYIILSSNRLYLSIPKLPKRFPFTIEYYKMLFSGELGFQKVKVFASYPKILGFTLNDDLLEEMITVYDHPKVLIFKKTPQYNAEYVRYKLSRFPDGVFEPLKENLE